MKKLPLAIAVSAAILSSAAVQADNGVGDNWTVNGYGHLLYEGTQSRAKNYNYEHRRDYRAAGPAFSANPNQVEFTLTKADTFENGAYANYVLKTEYGNNEGGDGDVYYYSSGGNEGHGQSGQLEFKEAYVELGNLSFFPEESSIWVGRRYLNRQAGIITKEFWKQSSGMGTGVAYKNFGLAILSADQGDNDKDAHDGTKGHTTMSSIDAYLYSVDVGFGKLDFDAKYMFRDNMDIKQGKNKNAADSGLGLSVSLASSFYGLDGWALTAVTYGKGMASTKGVNFGNWNGGWEEDDQSIFVTTYGVLNISENWQLGHELVYWNLDGDAIFGGQKDVTRIFYGLTPSYKVNENFRLEAIVTVANEALEDGSAWGREDDATTFFTATLAPVFTVNSDYFGRPQIKPYVTYMTSSEDSYNWGPDAKGNETRFGVEGEIWF